MKKILKFIFFEILVFALLGFLTFMEIYNFKDFKSVFNLIKSPSAWFVGLSLTYAFSNLFQKGILSFFRKKVKNEEAKKGDLFFGFIVALGITSIITPYAKNLMIEFFEIFYIYFHVIIVQSLIFVYLLFKVKNNFEISGKYFLTNELFVLFYTLLIILFGK